MLTHGDLGSPILAAAFLAKTWTSGESAEISACGSLHRQRLGATLSSNRSDGEIKRGLNGDYNGD